MNDSVMKTHLTAASFVALVAVSSAATAHEQLLCWPTWDYRAGIHDFNADGVQEKIVKSRRRTLNLVDGSGLATTTLEHKVKAVETNGSVLFSSPWLSVEGPRVYTASWALAPGFSPLGLEGNTSCEQRTIAIYDDGTGAQPWLVYTAGFAVKDTVSDLDVSRIRVWVIDASGTVRNRLDVNGVAGWNLSISGLRLADYDGDGNDDLVVARYRRDAPGSPDFDRKTKVFDLLTGALKAKFSTTYVISDVNLN